MVCISTRRARPRDLSSIRCTASTAHFQLNIGSECFPLFSNRHPILLVVRRSILHSNSDVALRAILGELLGHVAYVEDKALSGQHLMVLRRQRPDASNTGG